jgi:hypothetical protein
MEIDEMTRKRIEKHLDNIWDKVLKSNIGSNDEKFGGGAYWSALRLLSILGIEIQNRNKFD